MRRNDKTRHEWRKAYKEKEIDKSEGWPKTLISYNDKKI